MCHANAEVAEGTISNNGVAAGEAPRCRQLNCRDARHVAIVETNVFDAQALGSNSRNHCAVDRPGPHESRTAPFHRPARYNRFDTSAAEQNRRINVKFQRTLDTVVSRWQVDDTAIRRCRRINRRLDCRAVVCRAVA